MGRAYVLQYSQRWSEAEALFEKVYELIPDDVDEGLRAHEEHAWCVAQQGRLEDACEELQRARDALDELDGRGVDQARCWWRLGKVFWDMGGTSFLLHLKGTQNLIETNAGVNKEESFKNFITSLKRSPTFAPAFTSLGVYYAECTSPPDPIRASKCFQKAFELDAREVEAARRLAEGFAEEREWDLVEVVARRTIEGEGGSSGSEQQATGSRFLPVNAWAWKAVGVVELVSTLFYDLTLY